MNKRGPLWAVLALSSLSVGNADAVLPQDDAVPLRPGLARSAELVDILAVPRTPQQALQQRRSWLELPADQGGLGFEPLRLTSSSTDDDLFFHPRLTGTGVGDDVDSDGSEDVFTVHWDREADEIRFGVRSGASGARRWEQPFPDYAPHAEDEGYGFTFHYTALARMQVDTDAALDAVVYDEIVRYDSSGFEFHSFGSEEYWTRVAVIDEHDGAIAFSEDRSGVLTWQRSDTGAESVAYITADTVPWLIGVIPNAGTRPSPELLMASLTTRWIEVAPYADPVATTGLELEAIDGGTGVVDATRTFRRDHRLPVVSGSADLDGDADADLLVVEPDGERRTLSAYPFGAAPPHWSSEVDMTAQVARAVDVDGLPGMEVLVHQEWSRGPALEVLNGADGSRRWAGSGWGDAAYTVSDLDGDGGRDLIATDWSSRNEYLGETLQLRAIRGADGSALWSRTASVDVPQASDSEVQSWPYVWLRDLGDVTGDGRAEIRLDAGSYVDDITVGDRWGIWNVLLEDTSSEVIDGATGITRWSIAAESWGELPEPLDGDADGDGIADLVQVIQAVEGREGPFSVRVVHGATGDLLWTIESEHHHLFEPWTDAIDLAGGTGDEMIVNRSARDGEGPRSGAVSVHDRAGMRWEARAAD